jgi:hypothetical protein
MLKIFKTVIRANEGSELYERDSKHRVTMGYDDETKTIKVRVDEVRSPNPNLDESLPENTPTILRDVHTTADFVLVVEREFTASDFLMRTDNNKWIVEYNSETKQISDPIDVYELSKQYVNGSTSHEKIYFNLNEYRYQSNDKLTPLFVVDSFFKSLGFDGSTLQFFVEDLEVDLLDTILEVPAEQVTEATPKQYEFWNNYNVRVAITFEIIDSVGKVVTSAFPTLKPSAKAANFVTLTQKNPFNVTSGDGISIVPLTSDISGNRFYVQLPVLPQSENGQYGIRMMFGNKIHNLVDSRPYATFDIECVNGIVSKNRVTNEYDPSAPNAYVTEFIENHNHPADKIALAFAGVEGLVVQTLGYKAGDFFKLKLNVGEFLSYAELWVEIV